MVGLFCQLGARGGNRRVKVGWEGHTRLDGSGMFARLASVYIVVNGESGDRLGGFVLAGERWVDFSHRGICADLE